MKTMINTNQRMTGLPVEDAKCLISAARAIHGRNSAQAQTLLDSVLTRHPTHAEALRLHAILLLQLDEPELAISTLERALAHHPCDPLLHNDLGNMLNTRDRFDDATAAWRRAIELDPQLLAPWFSLGRSLYLKGETEAAVQPLQRARALAPNYLPAAVLLGNVVLQLGHLDEAAAHYRDALRLKPDEGTAWIGLGNIKTHALTDADAGMLAAQLARPDIADFDRVAMGHALGKLEEDRGHYPQSLKAFATANALQQRMTPWDQAKFERFVEAAIRLTGGLPAPLDPTLGSDLIFIVGQPRSGSTLVEQILAAHPQVEGASELPDLRIVLQMESRRRGVPYPDWIAQATAQDWQRLGNEYLKRTARWRQRKSRSTDKLPENWMHAGILRAMLPGATVIETRRDPLETAWSSFKQRFNHQPHFANSFVDIAAHIRMAEKAMDVFRSRDPARIHLHVYEDLLAESETRIRALLADCELEFDPACLDFHTAHRSVRTASAAQVRQPLRSDTARAIAYGALLNPLRAELGLPPT